VTWREDLRRVTITVNGKERNLVGASFRGVPFFVESSERAGGRRLMIHEFPLRDDPFGEDLGRRARAFRVEGYVLGDDYMIQRDALLEACEDNEGTGELLHPYYGVKRVMCETVTVREARADCGIAQFALEFRETPSQAPVPTTDSDATDQVSDAADAANSATDTEFQSKYNATGLPPFALTSAETALKNATSGLKDKLGPVITATQEAAQVSSELTLIAAEASSLVRTPALIVGRFLDVLSGMAQTVQNSPGDMMNALIAAYSVDLGPAVIATTTTRTTELANQTALTSALRRVFAIEAARLAPRVAYASTDDAIATRDQLSSILDAEAGTADDVAYPAIVDLRSHVQQAVPGDSVFASVVSVTRAGQIPTLLLAYQLYGSVDLEADIIARNDVVHPGFVSGTLKVLSSG
jgi:prophage DNA circulation protein